MPANAMGRRASVVIPPPVTPKNEPTTEEAGAEFKAMMADAGASRRDATDHAPAPEEKVSGDRPAPASEEVEVLPAPATEEGPAEAVTDLLFGGEGDGMPSPFLQDLLAVESTSEELPAEVLKTIPLAETPLVETAPEATEVLPESLRGSEAQQENPAVVGQAARLAATLLPSLEGEGERSTAGFERKSNTLEATRLGQAVEAAAQRAHQRGEHANNRGQGSSESESTPEQLTKGATEESRTRTGADESGSRRLFDPGTERPEQRLEARPRPSGNSMVRSAPAPTPPVAPTTTADGSLTATSRIAQGMEAAQMGAAEQDPLAGSVKINGVRGARLAVPMDDGSTVRARINLVDDTLDVAIRASEETGLRAEQRAGELRGALADHGIDLGEFDIASDAEAGDEASEGDEADDAKDSHTNQGQADGGDNGSDTAGGYGYGEDGGPGSLINRRL